MELDLLVSQALWRARNMERALHDPGPWFMRIEGRDYACLREVLPYSVVFRSTVDVAPGSIVDLYCGEHLVSSRVYEEVTYPGVWSLSWQFALDPEAARDVA